MASWSGHTPWYMEQRHKQESLGRQRRQRAWIALLVAALSYMTFWGARNLLG